MSRTHVRDLSRPDVVILVKKYIYFRVKDLVKSYVYYEFVEL